MLLHTELLLCILTMLTLHCHSTNAQPVNGSSTHELLDKLTGNYPKMGKFAVPRWGMEPVHVTISASLQHIIAVNRDKQSVSWRGYILYEWRDDFLTWDPDQFQGLTNIHLPADKIWTPDIAVADVLSEKCSHDDAVVISNMGKVLMLSSCIHEIRCGIDITYFPFDKQTCMYQINSWLHDNRTMIIKDFSISAYVGIFDWEVHKVNSSLETVAGSDGLNYPSVTVTFVIHHRAPLFAFLLILPAVLLSVLTSVVFLLPSCSENKIEIGLSIFLSYMVLLNILMDATQDSSAGVPLLGYYFTVNSLLIAMSVFCSTVVLRIYDKSISHKKMSPRLKKLTCFMAKILRMETERKPTDIKQLDDLTPAVRMVDTTPENCPPNTDWVLLAAVLDRLFFLIYVVINVTASLVVFARYSEDKHDWD